jgi:hypothetical protein
VDSPPPITVRISVGKICLGVFLGIVLAVFFLFFLAEGPQVWNRNFSQTDRARGPEYIVITREVPVKMSYGNIILPGGAMLVLSRNAHYAGVVEVSYQGEIIRIPVEATTLVDQW